MANKTPWQDFESWRDYGVEQGYNERNSMSLANSEDKTEKRWYARGRTMRCLNKFPFQRKHKKSPWQDFESWKQYGIEHKYDIRNPTNLKKSEDENERSWYNKGEREWYDEKQKQNWYSQFSFQKKLEKSPWQDFESWKQYGISQGYNERNPRSISNSDNKTERSWHTRGQNQWFDEEKKQDWYSQFPFQKKLEKSPWQDFESWKEYGIEQGYENRNPNSFRESEDKTERSWWARGQNQWFNEEQRQKWFSQFEFKGRILPNYKNRISSSKEFLSVLQTDETMQKLASASAFLNGQANDLEKILFSLYDDRFKDVTHVHQFISENRNEIIELAKKGLTNLGPYLGEYSLEDRAIIPVLLGQALNSIPQERIDSNLEKRLVAILRNVYGPQFNESPEETIRGLEKTIQDVPDKLKPVYSALCEHYSEVMKLIGEL